MMKFLSLLRVIWNALRGRDYDTGAKKIVSAIIVLALIGTGIDCVISRADAQGGGYPSRPTFQSVGVGASANAYCWANAYHAIRGGTQNASIAFSSSGQTVYIATNVCFDGTNWRIISTGPASLVTIQSGGVFGIAKIPSAAAGSIASVQSFLVPLASWGSFSFSGTTCTLLTESNSNFSSTCTSAVAGVYNMAFSTAYTSHLPTCLASYWSNTGAGGVIAVDSPSLGGVSVATYAVGGGVLTTGSYDIYCFGN